MSKKKKLTLLPIPLALLLAFYFWYTRPLTLEKLFPELDWDSLSAIDATAEEYRGMEGSYSLQPEDEAFSRLAEEVRSFSFRRSIKSLLPGYGRVRHLPREGDFQWEMYLRFGQDNLLVDNFYGRVSLHLGLTDYYCFLDTQDPWLREILEILLNSKDN